MMKRQKSTIFYGDEWDYVPTPHLEVEDDGVGRPIPTGVLNADGAMIYHEPVKMGFHRR